MRVKFKKTGDIVDIPDKLYNPNDYEPVSTTQPAQSNTNTVKQQPNLASSLGGGVLGLLGNILKPAVDYGKFVGGGLVQTPILAATKGRVNIPIMSEEELQQAGSGDLGKAALTGIKRIAGAASYAIPFGKGANLLSKVLAPGAGVGFLQGASEDNATRESIAGNTVLGAAGAGAFQGATNLAGAGFNTINKLLSAGGKKLADEAAQGIGKATPSMFQKAIEEHGIDVNSLIKKHVLPGSNYETLLGKSDKRGAGGIIGFKIGQAENTIKRAVEGAGATVRVSGDDFVKALNSEKSLLKKTVGNEEKTKALEAIIEETKKLFKNGISTKRLLDMKRAADSKFGKAVVEEQAGSVATSAQKIIANIARRKLKEILPSVKKALDEETELYTLKPILNRARSINQTPGSEIRLGKLSNIDLTKPGTLIDTPLDAATRNPEIASRMLSMGSGVPRQINTNNPLLNQVLGQTGANAAQLLTRPQIDGNSQNTTYNEADNQNGNETLNKSTNTSNIPQITYEQLQQVLLNPRVSAGMKKSVLDLYNIGQKTTVGGKPKSVTAQTQENLAKSGLRGLNEAEKIIDNDPNILLKQEAPGQLFSRKFDSALFRTVEALLRSRSGAAVPEQEVRRYLNKYGPRFGDDKNTVQFKLQQLRQDFTDVLNGANNISDPLQQLQNAGLQLPQ